MLKQYKNDAKSMQDDAKTNVLQLMFLDGLSKFLLKIQEIAKFIKCKL